MRLGFWCTLRAAGSTWSRFHTSIGLSQIMNSVMLLLHSPLDQFGADSFGGEFVSLFVCSFLDMLDIFKLTEMLDVSFLEGLISTFVGQFFFEDDDCADSE